MSVNLTPQAYDDLLSIRAWIASDNGRSADRVVSRLLQTIAMFERFPLLGRKGRLEGTRGFSVVGLPYIVVYAIVSESDVDVLTVVHSARQLPPL